MITRTIEEIKEMLKIDDKGNFPFDHVKIQGVSIDSRHIQQNNLFIPLKGEKVDGHRFVEDAIKKGAACSLWDKSVPNPPEGLPILMVDNTLTALQELARSYRKQLKMKVIGVTGSNGKTTTKDMITSLLSLKYKVQKTEGNFNNHIGLPLTILSLEEDTEFGVIEMGMSQRGEIEFLSNIALPHAVIITNIGESHLRDLGSREQIAEAKLEILSGLQKDGLVVYFGDEPLLNERLKNYTGNVQTFGRQNHNTIYPTSFHLTNEGSTFTTNIVDTRFHLPVLGAHNILNALGAMLIAHHFHLPFEKMNEGFANLKLTNMRMEMMEGKRGEKIINDAYNASPTSMKAAIDLVSQLTGFQNKVLVLGDMLELGNREEQFHIDLGKSINPDKIDYVFTYGTLGQKIAEGARSVFPENRVFSYLDKEQLLENIKKRTDKDTIILVKASRGMKLEEVVEGLLMD